MSTIERKKPENVVKSFTQAILSGWEDFVQQRQKNSDSTTVELRKDEDSPEFWRQQKAYQLTISIIIEQIEDDRGLHGYRISFPANCDLALSPYSKRSKKALEQTIMLVPKEGGKSTAVSMVYGISGERWYPLPPDAEYTAKHFIPTIISATMGYLDRAIQRVILLTEGQEREDDTNLSIQGTRLPKSLGGDQKKGGGGRLRRKVRTEEGAEGSARIPESNG